MRISKKNEWQEEKMSGILKNLIFARKTKKN